MKNKNYYIYILASDKNGTLYIGVTNGLAKRVSQHKEKEISGFTKKYLVDKLVYQEFFNTIEEAITREKNLKKWKRQWKINLIEKDNPGWRDLFEDMLQCVFWIPAFAGMTDGGQLNSPGMRKRLTVEFVDL